MNTLLDEICGYLHNYFVDKIHEGTYTVANGGIDLPLQTGQYFYVKGSVFNDGVWEYPATGMHDETFTGEIWAMAVPAAVMSLASDISEWITAYADSNLDSPFTSESFNNYSYSKAQSTSADGGYAPVTWQNIFSSRLARWRKLP